MIISVFVSTRLVRFHGERDRDSENKCDQVRECRLCCFGGCLSNPFTDQISGTSGILQKATDAGATSPATNVTMIGKAILVNRLHFSRLMRHTDHAFFLCRNRFDRHRLDDRHKCHIGICRHRNRSDVV